MRGWAARLVVSLTVLLTVSFVGLAGVGGWLYWNRVELRGEQTTRAEVAPLAAKQIPQVFAMTTRPSSAASTTCTRC